MATRGLSADEIKRRAQVAFDKADARKQEASRAMEAEQQARDAVLQKTARLRALRLAKEQADAETAAIVAAEQAQIKADIVQAKADAKAAKTKAASDKAAKPRKKAVKRPERRCRIVVRLRALILRPDGSGLGKALDLAAQLRPDVARMRRPRLLFVATEDWFFASHFLPMVRAARELDYDVAVIARERQHRRIIEGAGAQLIALEAERRSLDPRAMLQQIRALKRLIEAYRPDILHCIALKPIALAGLAGKLAGVERRVYALTGLGFLGARQGLVGCGRASGGARSGCARRSMGRRSASCSRTPTMPSASGSIPQDETKVTIVGGAGVDPLILMPLPMPPAPPLKVAIVARMLWSKGVDLAVEAVRLARAEGARVELTIHGAPDPSNPKAIPEATLQEWSQRPGVTWAGADARYRGASGPRIISASCPRAAARACRARILEAAACAPADPDDRCAGLPQFRARRARRHGRAGGGCRGAGEGADRAGGCAVAGGAHGRERAGPPARRLHRARRDERGEGALSRAARAARARMSRRERQP